MTRFLIALLTAAAMTVVANAHFVFVVPDQTATTAKVVLSDDLDPDEAVDIAKVSGVKLFTRDAAGKDVAVTHKADKHALIATLPGSGPRVVYGSVNYGVMQKGEGKPYLLAYHPKAIIGAVSADVATVGDKLPAELAAVPAGGKVRFKLTAGGKPVADAEVTVLKPDRSNVKVKTGTDGMTEAVDGVGRFGAWTRYFEPKAGELGGKKYEEIRHYPTLVVDVAASPSSALPPLPRGVSSLGAVECDGYLYVYGGHAGKTHSYDTTTVLGTFHRLKLAGGTAWEELPGGPILQGMNLAAHRGKVYRIGGMQPRNAPGEPTDNHSVKDCVRFDPKTGRWEPMQALPAGRSSHDVVVSGDRLVVVGGWESKGKAEKSAWHDTALVLDLSSSEPKWQSIPQPFARRALTAAVVGNKVYVLGGLGADGADRRVDILDVTTGKWTTGPALPGSSDRVAFSPAAATVKGRLFVNTSAGPVYRLNEAGDAWEKVGDAAVKRMVARLIPFGDAAILVGGAGGGSNVALVEVVKLAAKGEPVTAGQ